MFFKSKKELKKAKIEIEKLNEKIKKQNEKLDLYDGLLKSIQDNQKAGAKLIRFDDIPSIGSYIDDELFEKTFSGSINYLKANGIVKDDVIADRSTLSHYQIATHKFVKEYLNFCMKIATDRLSVYIPEYKLLTNQPKE